MARPQALLKAILPAEKNTNTVFRGWEICHPCNTTGTQCS
jgi:hypothetical protein